MASLEVRNLHVAFGQTEILRGIDFDLERGKTLGVVGESGCGKSMTGLALMGMVMRPGLVTGSIVLEGRELVGMSEREREKIRGAEIAMVMQDPFSSLNPVMKVGDQVAEVFRLHRDMSRRQAWAAAIEMFDHVGIPDPAASAMKYPHQMSGGQRQRVVIACAFACQPKILIADEPTTALDVTLQAQILALLKTLQAEAGTAVLLISHDIGVIATESDAIAVFYAGRIVEYGPAKSVLRRPAHPYTQALLAAMPRPGLDRLVAIGGQPPRFGQLPAGCSFAPRCPHWFEKCGQDPPLLGNAAHEAACWLVERTAPV